MKVIKLKNKQSLIGIICICVLMCFFISGAALGSSDKGDDEHGSGGSKGWVATDTYRVMNFAVLAGALFFLLRKPVTHALDTRIKEIREQLSELEAKKKDAEEKLSQYNKKLTHLDKEAEKIVEEYIKIGNQAKDKILKEAKFTAKKMEEQARQNIENEFKQAKLNLQADILERALVKAEKLIKSKITTDDQDRLVDEYFDKVVV